MSVSSSMADIYTFEREDSRISSYPNTLQRHSRQWSTDEYSGTARSISPFHGHPPSETPLPSDRFGDRDYRNLAEQPSRLSNRLPNSGRTFDKHLSNEPRCPDKRNNASRMTNRHTPNEPMKNKLSDGKTSRTEWRPLVSSSKKRNGADTTDVASQPSLCKPFSSLSQTDKPITVIEKHQRCTSSLGQHGKLPRKIKMAHGVPDDDNSLRKSAPAGKITKQRKENPDTKEATEKRKLSSADSKTDTSVKKCDLAPDTRLKDTAAEKLTSPASQTVTFDLPPEDIIIIRRYAVDNDATLRTTPAVSDTPADRHIVKLIRNPVANILADSSANGQASMKVKGVIKKRKWSGGVSVSVISSHRDVADAITEEEPGQRDVSNSQVNQVENVLEGVDDIDDSLSVSGCMPLRLETPDDDEIYERFDKTQSTRDPVDVHQSLQHRRKQAGEHRTTTDTSEDCDGRQQSTDADRSSEKTNKPTASSKSASSSKLSNRSQVQNQHRSSTNTRVPATKLFGPSRSYHTTTYSRHTSSTPRASAGLKRRGVLCSSSRWHTPYDKIHVRCGRTDGYR